VRKTRLLGWGIAAGFALCLAAVLVLATTFQAAGTQLAGARMAMRPIGVARQPALRASSAPRAQASHRYEQLPLAFEPTAPESSGDAKFLARGQGYALFLTPRETVLALGKHSGSSAALRLKMVGANAIPSFAALDELPGKSNYLLGNSPAHWRTNVPNYRKVAEHGVYNGIDIVYYGNQRQLEYDFVVAPGANPGVIQIAFQGAKNLRIDRAGDLLVGVSGGDVRLHRPIAYQGSGDAKQEVAAKYVLKNAHSVSFELARYDAGQQLVIDPVLSYSTYLGGSDIDVANAIAVAQDKTAFIAGGTFSTDFPTKHPLQPNVGGPFDFPKDAFVAKISADGSTLLYSTYLGGKLTDVANGIAVDAFGDAYITGTTDSFDFPVTFNSFNPACGGDDQCGAKWNNGPIVENAFVTKLNPAGSALIYSGFLGENEHVTGLAIAVDQNESAYVTGQVGQNIPAAPIVLPDGTIKPNPIQPPPFRITVGAFQPFHGGGATDAYVAKISSSGTSIEYSSYLGGFGDDSGYGIAVDNAGNAFVVGITHSAGFPVTADAAQTNYGGAGDAFLAEVNTGAFGPASLVYSTFLGGSELDQANGVALDFIGNVIGNVYVAGGTNSEGLFPLSAGFAKSNSGNGDAFVAKLNPAIPGAAGVVYFTYLGGSKADSAAGIAVDNANPPSAYVTGTTVSAVDPLDPLATPFPIVTATAFQPTYGGGNADAFVTELNSTGTALLYSSYLGGTNAEGASGIAVDRAVPAASAYVTGQTCSQDFPISNPLQAAPGGNCDAYITKVSIQHGIAVNPAGLVFPAQSLGTTSAPQIMTITNGDSQVNNLRIVPSGPQSGDFLSSNNCPTSPNSISPGSQCEITVTFTPSASGIRKALITITGTDALGNAIPSPVLNLTGSTSTVTLSASSLAFGTQTVGTSSVQQVIVTNTGTVALAFSSITASGDFSETNNCTVPLQPTTNCKINVTYNPLSQGSSIAALTLTDNGSGSPQIVLLTGTGFQQSPDFTISSPQPIATISAGQPANYSLTISPLGGFSQPVALSCSGLPREATCLASANPVTVTGTTQITVTVTTSLRTFVPMAFKKFQFPGSAHRYDGVLSMSFIVFLCFVILARMRFRPATGAFGLAIVLLLLATACGGGSQSGLPAGTPAGTSQIVVMGTSGSLTHPVTLTLVVK
jgi:hypothetical protein